MEIFLAGSVGLLTLARVTVMMVRSMARGVIVDAREEILTVQSEPNLPPGAIILRHRNGDVQLVEMDRGTFAGSVEKLAAHMSTRGKA
jgi:hypothetical protein